MGVTLCAFNDAPQATLPAIDSSGRSPGCLVLELLERCESDVVTYSMNLIHDMIIYDLIVVIIAQYCPEYNEYRKAMKSIID